MPTATHPEPHAVTRLRERFGVELTTEQLRWLSMMLNDPRARFDGRRFRFVRRLPDRTAIWQLNLEHFVGSTLWVAAVISDDRARIITVLPYPANLTVSALDKALQAYVVTRGRRPSYAKRFMGVNYLPQGVKRA